jgi:hypothetical protein
MSFRYQVLTPSRKVVSSSITRERIQSTGVCCDWARFWAHGKWVGLVAKLAGKVAEVRPGEVTKTELARIERDEGADLAGLGLQLAESKASCQAAEAGNVNAELKCPLFEQS